MQGFDEHHRPSKSSWTRSILGWLGVLVLLSGVLFLRYGWFTFFDKPELIIQDTVEDFIEISPESSFVLEFDQRMKKDSVEQAVSIDPDLPHHDTWEGNSLLLKPDHLLEVGRVYEVSIKSTAKSFFGKPLNKSYSLSYLVGKDPGIVKIFPDRADILPAESIMVLFSHPMVSEQQLRMDIVPEKIRITPQVDGNWKWRNSKLLVFTPKSGFPFSGRYHLENTAPLKTFDDTPINQPIDAFYETERLQLLSAEDDSRRCQSEGCPVTDPFVFTFNTPLNLSSLQKQASLKDSTGKILNDVTFHQLKDSATSYSVEKSSGNWLYNERYFLALHADLMPRDGNLSLGNDQELTFTTQSFSSGEMPFVSTQDPRELYLVDRRVMIKLREPIDPSVLKKSVTVVPGADADVEFIDPVSFRVILKRELQADEKITLYISNDLNSPNHSYISQPIKYLVGRPPVLRVETMQTKEHVCILSKTALTDGSSMKVDGDQRQFWSLVSSEDDSECSRRDEFPFHYDLEKKFLSPSSSISLRLDAVDAFDQRVSKVLVVKTYPLNFQDIVLSIPQTSYYQYFNRAEDLKVLYSSRNIDDVKIELCRLSAKDALQVETTYDKKWSSFQVSSRNCLGSKSFSEHFKPEWGQNQDHILDLNEVFDEIVSGIYYVHIFLPDLADAQGDPIEIGTVLQLSNWDILSKRGESAFLWILDHQSHEPVSGAVVEGYANDGNLIQSGLTNEKGIAFEKVGKGSYDFALVKKDKEEILLNIFHQNGFEPGRFSIPFNAEDNIFRYHFFVEDLGDDLDEIRGAVMVQEKSEMGLVPFQQPVTLSLSSSEEEIFWKKTMEFDPFGVFHFDIQSPYPLLDGTYQLSVCIGKFAGLCEGTNLWASLMIRNGTIHELLPSEMSYETQTKIPHENISVDLGHEAEINEEISVDIRGLKTGIPILVTAERDDIYFSHVTVPDAPQVKVPLKITSSMTPEVMITVTQFDHRNTVYDMISIPVSRHEKDVLKNGVGIKPGNYSATAFKLRTIAEGFSDDLLEFLYPRLGTGVVTGSNRDSRNDARPEHSLVEVPTSRMTDLSVINGKLLSPEDTAQFAGVDVLSDEGLAKSDTPIYVLVNDKQGRGSSIVLHHDETLSELSIRANIPEFIRPEDKVIIPVWVRNLGKSNRNVQVSSTGVGIDFLSGQSLMLGISMGQEKFFYQPTQVSPIGSSDHVSLTMTVKDHDLTQANFVGKLPLAKIHHQYSMKSVMMIQYEQNHGTIEVPLAKPGLFHVKMIMSPSPMSFVLENLNDVLKRDSLRYEEEFFKKVAAVQYFNLMQATLESNQEFSPLLEQQNSIDDELYFLSTRQKVDGGWSRNEGEEASDPWLTANIARSLSVLQQFEVSVPEATRAKVISYLKKELQRISSGLPTYKDARKTPLLLLLNALSSLTPAGIITANNLFIDRNELSTVELVSLLLTFEDYRDAGVNGMNYKIEELTQLLKEHEKRGQDQVWMENDPGDSSHFSDFMLTSWYLEALVRQASARSDIPEIITWLVRHKYKPEFSTLNDQCYFLQAMAGYLQIFHADIRANDLSIDGDLYSHDFKVDRTKPFQSFVIDDFFLKEEDSDANPTMTFHSDQSQPWFVEVSWTYDPRVPFEIHKGISVYQEFDAKEVFVRGATVTGFISIVSPEAYDHVIVAQPLVAAIRDVTESSTDDLWYSKSFGKEEKWFVFDHLPAGETIIPFQWQLDYAGIFKTPAIQVWSSDHPEIFSQSNILNLEIRLKD